MLITNAVKYIRKRLYRTVKRTFSKKQLRRSLLKCFGWRHRLRRFPFAQLDSIQIIGNKGVLVQGVLIDPKRQVERVELLFHDNKHRPVEMDLSRFRDERLQTQAIPLHHSEKPGFLSLASLPENSRLAMEQTATPYGIQLTLVSGRKINRRCRKPATPPRENLDGVRQILTTVPHKTREKRTLFDDVYGPAVEHVWSHRKQTTSEGNLLEYNTHLKPANPAVTVVIPIYGRHDFIEYQLSSFSTDPDMQNHELLFVIDDPRLTPVVKESAEWLKKIYSISFNILYLEQNLGYAGANNAGVRTATAQNILLLNSDVLPIRDGWLTELITATGDNIKNALVGARLLYEDNSVQHDGMEFFASPFVDNLWTNIHPGKGLPVDLFDQNKTPVDRQLITGACLLITKSNYELIGGLDERYILGDFEDSDLCMRARQHGLEIKLLQNVELYHLERQSQALVSSDRWKQELTYYNCWQHTQQWDGAIRRLNAGRHDA